MSSQRPLGWRRRARSTREQRPVCGRGPLLPPSSGRSLSREPAWPSLPSVSSLPWGLNSSHQLSSRRLDHPHPHPYPGSKELSRQRTLNGAPAYLILGGRRSGWGALSRHTGDTLTPQAEGPRGEDSSQTPELAACSPRPAKPPPQQAGTEAPRQGDRAGGQRPANGPLSGTGSRTGKSPHC